MKRLARHKNKINEWNFAKSVYKKTRSFSGGEARYVISRCLAGVLI